MAENKLNSRAKKTLQLSKEFAKTTRDCVTQEKDKILEIITNTIVDSKIEEKEAKLKTLADMYDENEVDAINALKLDEISEKRKLSEEYDCIVRKQLQMLQADERGKIALQNEIAEIKNQQRKRSDVLKARKKALMTEKERSKRIAALPPPLSRSVRQLLKEQEKKGTTTDENIFPQTIDIEEEELDVFEDKENMDNYHEQRRLMQEEFDRKAKKRFNEALKKDRQKQEHAKFLKDIENAEKSSRRQMARSVSDTSGKVPCTLTDRLNYVEKQATMEDAVENVLKKCGKNKEHAIEDLEGYEDKWEAKYKQIDSNLETKMIDCVPSFVKENYSYLLEEEPARQCGNRFARLDESADELNMAFTESPTEALNSSDKIAAVLSHLGQMMSESNEVYEKEFKPLLEADILKGDLPKLESFDKAVEANILRLPTEDKSVEVCEEMSSRNEVLSTSRSTQANFMNSGLMAFKRKSLGSKYRSQLGYLSDPLAQFPSWTEPQISNSTLGSSSSYYSIPSNHGRPDICNLCDSPTCKLPLAEDKNLHKDCIPLSKSQDKDPVDVGSQLQHETPGITLSPASVKSKISSYIQLVADKYLKKQEETKSYEQASVDQLRLTENIPLQPSSTVAAEEIILDDNRDVLGRQCDALDFEVSSAKLPRDVAVEKSNSESAFDEILQKTEQMILAEIPSYSEMKSSANMNRLKQEEIKQRCHEILSESLSNIFSGHDETDEDLNALKAAISDEVFEATKKVHPGEFIYHELSTIHEVDSALTNDTMQSRRDSSKRLDKSRSSSSKSSPSTKSGFLSPEEIDTTSASLVDAPASDASELAKQIRFVAEPPEEQEKLIPQDLQLTTPCGLISGTLSTLQTPSSRTISEAITPRPTVISDIFDTPSFLTMTNVRSNAITPSTLKTESSLQTPSSQLSTHSLQSGMSYGTPYSSSFQSANVKHPHLTNLEALPRHFKDISSIRQDSCSSQGSAREIRPIDDKQTVPKTIESRTTARQIFFPNDYDGQFQTDEKSTASFKPMTPHSCVSSPGLMDNQSRTDKESAQKKYHRRPDDQTRKSDSTPDSFKPMTPHSYMSNPSQTYPKDWIHDNYSEEKFDHKAASNEKVLGSRRKDGSSCSSFQPMTPHSYLSTPNLSSQKQALDSKRKGDRHQGPLLVQNDDNTASGFQPMTPHSYMSTPNLPSERRKDRYDQLQTRPPLYEEDSTANGFQPMTPHSNVPTPTMHSQTKQQKNARHQAHSQLQQEDTASGFQSMTPHSYFSTPSLPSEKSKEQDRHHQANPSLQEQTARGHNYTRGTQLQPEDTASGFLSMTPHSYFSTPSLPSERPNEQDRHHQASPSLQEQTASGFQSMTQHSHLSTPKLSSQQPPQQISDSKIKGSQLQKNSTSQEGNTASGFQSMTPHSHLPSQSNEDVSSIEDLRQQSSASTVNLRLRIPMSSISEGSLEHSTPRSGASATDFPSDLSYKSLKLRFNIKTQDYMNPDADVEDYVMGDGSHMQPEMNIPMPQYLRNKTLVSACDVVKHGADSPNKKQRTQNALKVPKSDFFVPQLSTADLAADKDVQMSQLQKRAKVCSSDAFIPQLSAADMTIGEDAQMSRLQKKAKLCSSDAFVPQLSVADMVIDKDAQVQTAAKVCSSDAFVPKLSARDLSSEPSRLQKGYFSCELADYQEKAYKDYTNSTPSISSLTSSSSKSNGSSADHRQLKRLVASSSKDGSSSLSSCSSEAAHQSVNSPNPIMEALRKKFGMTSSSKGSSSCGTPTLSHGSLSDISVSKITCQSTPMKSIEDIIQETGILDEPDLTLITTNLTIKPESPERTRHFSEKSNARELNLMTYASPNSNPTTTLKATTSYCESPSMMSFLQHEKSCFADSKVEADSNHNLNSIQETLTNEDEFGKQQFAKNQPKRFEYKKRTQRLWNNLEEVKTRKTIEEKKKQLVENRLKMKAYTRIYNKKTPEL